MSELGARSQSTAARTALLTLPPGHPLNPFREKALVEYYFNPKDAKVYVIDPASGSLSRENPVCLGLRLGGEPLVVASAEYLKSAIHDEIRRAERWHFAGVETQIGGLYPARP